MRAPAVKGVKRPRRFANPFGALVVLLFREVADIDRVVVIDYEGQTFFVHKLSGAAECAAYGRLRLNFVLNHTGNHGIEFIRHPDHKRAGPESQVRGQGRVNLALVLELQAPDKGFNVRFDFLDEVRTDASEFSALECFGTGKRVLLNC